MSRTAPHSPEYVGKKVVSAVDWRGNRFRVGDKVLYCVAVGRGQLMAEGVVMNIVAVTVSTPGWEDCDPNDPDAVYREWFRSYSRRVDRSYDQLKVQVHTLRTSGRWDNEEQSKPVWVNPANVTAPEPVGST